MSLTNYRGGNGGHFITAKELNALKLKEIEAMITGTPFESTFDGTDDDGNPKTETVLRLPMEVKGLGEGSWSPGKNAREVLIETIGPEWANWSFPVKGHFEKREWSNSRGQSGLAWNFVPDSSVTERPKESAATKKGPTQNTSKDSTSRGNFRCTFPGCNVSTATMADLKEHFRTHAPK